MYVLEKNKNENVVNEIRQNGDRRFTRISYLGGAIPFGGTSCA